MTVRVKISVCMGFLKVLMVKVLSVSSVTKVSKNDIEPSGQVSSTVTTITRTSEGYNSRHQHFP